MAEGVRDHLTLPQYVADFEMGTLSAWEFATDALTAMRHFCEQTSVDFETAAESAFEHWVVERDERAASERGET